MSMTNVVLALKTTGENDVECSGEADIYTADFLAVGKGHLAIFWPTQCSIRGSHSALSGGRGGGAFSSAVLQSEICGQSVGSCSSI